MLAALIIVFREVFEAGLIIGIVLAVTRAVSGRGWWISARPNSRPIRGRVPSNGALRPNFGPPEVRFFRLSHDGGLVAPTTSAAANTAESAIFHCIISLS